MFDFSKWLVQGIIDGYKKGYTPFSKVTELTAAYYSKGLINQEQVEEIGVVCPAPFETEEESEELQ
jgi:hypothetical protein